MVESYADDELGFGRKRLCPEALSRVTGPNRSVSPMYQTRRLMLQLTARFDIVIFKILARLTWADCACISDEITGGHS
jgi:hypothetical protein